VAGDVAVCDEGGGVAGEVRLERGVGEVALGAAEPRCQVQALPVGRVVKRLEDRAVLEDMVQQVVRSGDPKRFGTAPRVP
jgi:hypothetical protein